MGGRRWTVQEKIELLKAAEQLGASEACRRARATRDSFYRWKRAYELGGEAGLRPKSSPPVGPYVRPKVEDRVLRLARESPELGKARVASMVSALPYGWISPTGVRCVWLRHRVGTTRRAREAWAAAQPQRRQKSQRREEDHPEPAAPVHILDAEGKLVRVALPEEYLHMPRPGTASGRKRQRPPSEA